MELLFGYALAAIVGSVAGLLACSVFLEARSKRREQASFAALGLLVGFLIGMSESPLIAGAVTGGFTLAGAMIGKIWDQSSSKAAGTSGGEHPTTYQVVVVSDAMAIAEDLLRPRPVSGGAPQRREENANGAMSEAPSPLGVDWLLAISAAALVGVVVGAGVRINGVLNLRDQSIPARLRPYGFNEVQIQSMMARFAASTPLEQIVKADTLKGISGLQAKEIENPTKPSEPAQELPFDWAAYWASMNGNTPAYVLDNLIADKSKGIVPESFRAMILSARKSKMADQAIVDHLKSLTDHHP